MAQFDEKPRDELVKRIGELEGVEKKLKESQRLLEYAQKISHLANWTWDIERDNFYGSREAYRIFEMPPGTPMPLSGMMGFVHPEDRALVRDAIEDGLRGAVYKFEFRIKTRNGYVKHVQVMGELESRNGKPVALNGTIQDLTERKELENEQRMLIGELQYAQRRAHLGNWVWDIESDNFFGSQESYYIVELPVGTPVNYARLMEMIHPEDRPLVRKSMEQALGGVLNREEFRIISGTGKLKYIQAIGELKIQNGRKSLIGTIQDITEKKELENEQKKLIAELEHAQKTAHFGDWAWDIASDNFSGSQESYDIFELPRGTPISYAKLIGMIYPEDRTLAKTCLEEALKGVRYEVEFRIISGLGRMKYLHGIGEPDMRDGRAVAVTGTIQDITEKKELENEQKKLISELQEALGRIKTLSGLLPICASCKRIRDEEGNWSSMEKYIEKHSEAEFTHSICPDCEERLYGKERKAGNE
ncbi:MAG: PAS domain-containing protein [Thermodesulfobacteriota bacterium]|nr:MAG: PAS domain-containing protein [Thermodesulfobacteriota bacterium]